MYHGVYDAGIVDEKPFQSSKLHVGATFVCNYHVNGRSEHTWKRNKMVMEGGKFKLKQWSQVSTMRRHTRQNDVHC